jgi:hypothetical protein
MRHWAQVDRQQVHHQRALAELPDAKFQEVRPDGHAIVERNFPLDLVRQFPSSIPDDSDLEHIPYRRLLEH